MRAQTVMSSGDALTMGSTLSSELSHAHPCRHTRQPHRLYYANSTTPLQATYKASGLPVQA